MKQFCLAVILLSMAGCAWAQQLRQPLDYVGRYDVFAGYTYLDTPKMNLMERGFITQDGINLNRWLALGIDFSVMNGQSDLKINELVAKDQAAFHAALPTLPLSYGVHYNSITYTMTGGPQFNIRPKRFPKLTFLVHPSLGAIRETVTGAPANPTQAAIMSAFVPGGKRTDLTYFYGVGGGVQYKVSKHMGIRFTLDVVRVHLFDYLLAETRTSMRFGIGPAFSFGPAVRK